MRNRTEKALAQRGDLQKKSIGSCYLYVTFLKGSVIDLFSIWGESGFKVKVMDDEFVILDLACRSFWHEKHVCYSKGYTDVFCVPFIYVLLVSSCMYFALS